MCLSIQKFLALSLLFVYTSVGTAQPAHWQSIAKDVALARVQLKSEGVFSPELLFVRFSLRSYKVGVVRARKFETLQMDAKSAAKASRALLTINANFFDERGKALGLVLSQGVKYNGIHLGGRTLTGIFSVSRNAVSISHRDDFSLTTAIEAIQSGPRLITAGHVTPGIKASDTYSRRAGVCVAKDNHVVFFISSGLIGLTITQLQNLLATPEVACIDGLNLDGGGSAQLFLSPKLPEVVSDWQEVFIHGHDRVPVFLAVFAKP